MEGTADCEKFDFCVVVSIRMALVVVCVPSAVVLVVVAAGAAAGGGAAAFFLWKAPSAELPSALPTIPSLPASPAAVWAAVSVATWPATEPEPLAGAAAGAVCAVFCAVVGPVPLAPMRVTSMTRVPFSFDSSFAICAMASADPGLPPKSCAIPAFWLICAFQADISTPAISFCPIRRSKSWTSFTSGGSGAIHASVVITYVTLFTASVGGALGSVICICIVTTCSCAVSPLTSLVTPVFFAETSKLVFKSLFGCCAGC